ncbi:MAG: oligosaccharide flippase family protein [Bacilli bacterium]|nr:oligosaccharide flippase family protein [Bacilli bacterium]
MKNNKFLKSTLILIVGSLITKVMGFIIRILYTRIIGSEGISLYTLIMPTYSLIVTIAGFAMPITISKLISEGKIRSKTIMSQAIFILLTINIITMLIIILSSNFISNTLLNEPRVKVLLIGATLSMPNMALACILKGYFYGIQKMLPNTISNIIEQSIRIIFIIFFLPKITNISIEAGILSFLLINILTEGASILTFIFLLPKNVNISLKDIKYNKEVSLLLFNDSLPLISGKIIGSIGFFFEPIILSNTFLLMGYPSNYFTLEYGIYNGYALSLLMMPSFIIASLCTALIPEISKYYAKGNIKHVKKRIKQSLIISFIFGLIITIFIFIKRDYLLNLLYNTNKGSNYIAFLSIFFVLYYLEAPLSSILQALNYSKFTMKTTTIGVIIKLILMFLLSLLKIGLYSLVIAEAINIIYIVYKNYNKIKKIIKKKEILLN